MSKKFALSLTSAALLALTACAQGGGAEVDAEVFEDPTAGEVPADSLEGGTLTFVSYGGGFQDGQAEAFAYPFGEETGAEVLEDGPIDDAQLRAQVEAGNVSWDVVNHSPVYNEAYCDELYEPLNYDLIDLSEYPESLPSGDCYISSLLYGYGITYDADEYGEDGGPQTWEDFFDTENYPGTRSVNGNPLPTGGTLEAALLADGVDPGDLYPLDIDRAIAKWEEIEDDLTFWTTGAEQTQQIQGGEADIVFGWTGRIYEGNVGGANFRPTWDANFVLADTFAIPKDTENLEAAHAFINYAIGETQQTEMAELTSYSPVNENSDPDFDEDLQMFDVSAPEVLDESIEIDWAYWAENIDEITEAWSAFIN